MDAVLPPPPSPEEAEREHEAFLSEWTSEIVAEAHEARARRARGEPERPLGSMTGLQIMGAAVSYWGFEPPEPIRAEVYRLTHEEPVPGMIDAELADEFNEVAREVLRRAIVRFVEETKTSRETASRRTAKARGTRNHPEDEGAENRSWWRRWFGFE